jgi:hypothetical protein
MVEDVGREAYEERVRDHLAERRPARMAKGDSRPNDRFRDVGPEHLGPVAGIIDRQPGDRPGKIMSLSPGRGQDGFPGAGWCAYKHQRLLPHAVGEAIL